MAKLFALDCDSFKVAIAIFENGKCENTLLISADKKLDADKRGFKLYLDFSSILDNYKPDEICIERSVYLQSFPATASITKVIGYCTLAANQHNIPYTMIHNTSWKKHLTGRGNSKKPEIKEAVIRLGYSSLIDDKQDLADAIGIGLFYLHQKEREKKENEPET